MVFPCRFVNLCSSFYLKASTRSVETSGSALRDRARAYVDSVPYNGGGRNNAAFSLAGHLYSLVGDLGERLSEAEVLSFVQGWNAILGEPLPDGELRTAVSSAGKNGTPREPKYSGMQSPFPDVDISMLTDSPCTPTKGSAVNPKANLPDELCFPEGIIGVGAKHMMSTSDFDQIAERRIGEAPLSAAFWSRASEKTSRLALISAISRGSSTIEMCDAEWSIAVSNFLTRRTIALTSGNVASTPHELNVLKLLKVVSELGGIAGMGCLANKQLRLD